MSKDAVVEQLNAVLAESTVFYQKLRAYHWTVNGPDFFELHAKFEELYNEWALHIDAVAERILTVGGTPLLTLTQMQKHASIQEASGNESAQKMVAAIVADLETIVRKLEDTISAADDAKDPGTVNALDGIRDGQQKTLWMLKAWLGKEASLPA